MPLWVTIQRIIFLSRLRREPTVTVRKARESKSSKSLQIKQISIVKNIKIWQIWIDL